MKLFTEHPRSIGETYFQHLRAAFGFGGRLFMASMGCFLHGLFPFLCVKTGSKAIKDLNHKMVTHRDKRCNPCDELEVNSSS